MPMDVNKRIHEILESLSLEVAIQHHAPVYTMTEAESVSTHPPEEGLKCLALLGSDGRSVVACIRGSERADLARVAATVGIQRVALCPVERLEELFGVSRGGMSPFGYAPNVVLVVDASVFRERWLYFNAGTPSETARISGVDFERVMDGVGALRM